MTTWRVLTPTEQLVAVRTEQWRDKDCPYCNRICPRCGYQIDGGWDHVEQVQSIHGSHWVCSLKRHVGPMVEVISGYFDHAQNISGFHSAPRNGSR